METFQDYLFGLFLALVNAITVVGMLGFLALQPVLAIAVYLPTMLVIIGLTTYVYFEMDIDII